MSTAQDITDITPAIKTGLNSRYRRNEHEDLQAEAEAGQNWFDRVNKHTELHRRMGGLYYEFRPVTDNTKTHSTGIIIDEQQVYNLKDLR